MFNGSHYYHKLVRTYTIAFGNLLNNIWLVRTGEDGEVTRFKVPVKFGPKEKWYARTNEDPDLNKPIENQLPIIGLEVSSFSYDPTRQQPSLQRMARGASSNVSVDSTYVGTPYDLGFSVTLGAKTYDDGHQIIEQILPMFNPTYTFSMIPLNIAGFSHIKDIPVQLRAVQGTPTYEGPFEERRDLFWQLDFNMKVYFYGPVTPRKIIKIAYANTYLDPVIQSGAIVRMNLDGGNHGTYKLDSVAFQGRSLEESTAAGVVLAWNPANNTIRLGGAQGTFRVGTTIHCVDTNAAYNLVTFDATPLKLTAYRVAVDPITAEPGDDFGYDESIKEFPDTL